MGCSEGEVQKMFSRKLEIEALGRNWDWRYESESWELRKQLKQEERMQSLQGEDAEWENQMVRNTS